MTDNSKKDEKPGSVEKESRKAFEKWIICPPFEASVDRYSDDHHTWPGQYESYNVELAWKAWCAALRLVLK